MTTNTTVRRVALVTGGMGGLGSAICRHLAQAGHRVLTTYSATNSHHEQWLKKQSEQGFSFHAYQVDVSDYQACQATIQKIRVEVGPVDILVNNAGITRDSSARKMRPEDWSAVLRTNLEGRPGIMKKSPFIL